LTLPPFFQSKKKVGLTEDTQDEAISWMREITKKAIRKGVLDSNKDHGFTPYTQRPIELWVKYEFLPRLERDNHFEIDEAFGGNKAPLTARMQYLSRYFSSQNFVECWPKLTLAVLTEKFSIKSDWVKRYRKIQDGVEARAEILEHLIEEQNLFIYENDLNRLTHNLGCFDSFLCALSALLFEKGKTFRRPESFPFENEWLAIPTL
jgi:hypothetical protein